MRANLTQAVFDATAATYDRDRSRLIPPFEAFYGWALRLVPPGAKRILELGAGSGLFTEMLVRAFPDAQIHCVDFSEPMLELARERIQGAANVNFERADYVKAQLSHKSAGGWCAVVSSLSIHHLSDEDKRTVFARMHDVLVPNGVFVNADQVLGPTEELEARYKRDWLDEVRASGATEQQIADSLKRQAEDRCASVEEQVGWMRAAGFADADEWFKHGRFAVIAGTKR
jgi:tRNA (cmo5U34)-methyltransferase